MSSSTSSRLCSSLLLAAALIASAPAESRAVDADALLQALVKKGVLSEKDAAALQQQNQEDDRKNDANKLRLSRAVDELRLYGDVRLRYQYDSKDFQVDPASTGSDRDRSPSGTQRSRFALRLRLNADFKLKDNWFGGVELQTGYQSDSANQALENGFTDYPIFVSRAFFGYAPTDWLTLTAGKVPNPFYTTELVWDSDINPAGFTEQVALHRLFAKSRDAVTEGGDGKRITVAGGPSKWEFTLVAGQFIFDDNPEGGGSKEPGANDTDSHTDAWLFETQLIAAYRFSPNVKLTIAPAWMIYTAASVSVPTAITDVYGDFNTNSFQDSKFVSGATRNLNIIDVPGDVSFTIRGLKTRVFWDFAYNIEGRARAEQTYQLLTRRSGSTDPNDTVGNYRSSDAYAYLLGLQLGENRRKGDLSFVATWRQIGVAAVDPNLNENDYPLGELNMRGVRFALNYNLTDASVLTLNYGYAWNLRKNLVGGEATSDNAVADANVVHLFQVDLNVKF